MGKTLFGRLGNKNNIAQDIIKHFPEHRMYIELFFGAGGMFFNKPKTTHTICNDYDNEIYNVFDVLKRRKEDLIDVLTKTIVHETLFKKWQTETEEDEIDKAVRFLILSNFSLLGKQDTLAFSHTHTKKVLLEKINLIFEDVKYVRFMKQDFRDVIKKVNFIKSRPNQRKFTFIYADPPYLGTTSKYNVPEWTEKDSLDLINMCKETDLKMAISEFDNPKILEMAKGLNIIEIGERKNLKNRRKEILITNYNKEELF